MAESVDQPRPALLEMRRIPRQARSRVVVESLCEATEEILLGEGPEVLTSHRIAERAGVDIASLYRYFENKEGLIARVYESRLSSANLSCDLEAMNNIDPHDGEIEEKLHGLVERIADQHAAMLDLHPDFYREHLSDFDLSRRWRPGWSTSWRHVLSSWLAAMLTRNPMRHRRLDADTSGFLAFRVLYGVLDSAVVESPDYVRDPGFREQLYAATLHSIYG